MSAESEEHEESITIRATPDAVYALVSDVTRTGEWSPVCAECWWLDDADGAPGGPHEGAWFGGRQEIPGRTWETRSLVTRAEPGRAFHWQVEGRFVRWGYDLEALDDGIATELTESWRLNDATHAMFAEKYGERGEEVLDARRQEALAGIPATLARLKAIAEDGASGR